MVDDRPLGPRQTRTARACSGPGQCDFVLELAQLRQTGTDVRGVALERRLHSRLAAAPERTP
jgi:hypothetical protein